MDNNTRMPKDDPTQNPRDPAADPGQRDPAQSPKDPCIQPNKPSSGQDSDTTKF